MRRVLIALVVSLLPVLLGPAVEARPAQVSCQAPVVANDPGQCSAAVACSAIATCTDGSGNPGTLACTPTGPFPVGNTDVAVTCTVTIPLSVAPAGGEFQSNSLTAGSQRRPAACSAAAGGFVVVWDGPGDGSGYGVFGQRYDSAGSPLGAEFLVNAFTTGSQFVPAVACDASGNFVVVWEELGVLINSRDGSGRGVFGRRFTSAGTPLGGDFQVNTTTGGDQRLPGVTRDAAGGFAVAWSSSGGIYGQRFAGTGAPLGSEFQVNTTLLAGFYPSPPAVAGDAGGDFVVVWRSASGFGYDILGQRYDSAGAPAGGEFQANSTLALGSYPPYPGVASDADGDFIVVWDSTGDGSYAGVFGRRYDSAGAAVGGQFQINTFTVYGQYNPEVASTDAGEFMVAWSSYYQDGSGFGMFGQAFDSTGAAVGGEFQANTFTPGYQGYLSALTSDADGDYVVVWEGGAGQDGSGFGIFGQRYGTSGGQETAAATCRVTVADTEPPAVTCAATPVVGGDGALQITFGASDNCGVVTLSAEIAPAAGPEGAEGGICGPVPVSNGQVVSVECGDDGCEVETGAGVLEVEAAGAVLTVTATDAAGNTASCTADLCPPEIE